MTDNAADAPDWVFLRGTVYGDSLATGDSQPGVYHMEANEICVSPLRLRVQVLLEAVQSLGEFASLDG